MKTLFCTAVFFACTAFCACTGDEDASPVTASGGHTFSTCTGEPPKGCHCTNLLIGYFEMEDCILYLPVQQPFSCQGYDLLKIAWNFEQHRVTFRSTDYRFCKAPVELWTYEGEPFFTAEWSCEAEVIEAQLDFNGHELDLELDEDFLLCAFEQEEGFWFALAVE